MKLQDEKRWVCWKAEKVGGRMTKVPYTVTGRKASSTDESTWTDFKTAKAASVKFSGVGVVFTPAKTLLGIDIDHVLEDGKLIGEHAAAIKALITEADTYTEVSPSGTGLHLYLKINGPLELTANRHAPFEAYTSGRYFTYTEQPFGKAKTIRLITAVEAVRLLTIIGYPWGKAAVVPNGTKPLSVASDDDTAAPLTKATPSGGTGSTFTDAELLNHMFAAKSGAKTQKLYEGDISAHSKDYSRADAALLNHLAFWSGKDAAQMERIWLASPLGSREKTQQRQDYRTRSIDSAIANCKEVYSPSPRVLDDIHGLDLLFTINSQKDKVYTQNTENMCRILRHHPEFAGRLRFDGFTDVIEYRPHEEWRPFEDADVLIFQTRISIIFSAFRKVGKDMIFDATVKVAKENTIDSAADFIKAIKYDGVARIDTWLSSTYGVEDNVYHRAVGANWIKGLVKRIIDPGCKFDHVLVLEGPQGSKKSTSLLVLGEINKRTNWHVETTMSTESKDFFEQFTGKAIIEFSEGETLSRTEVKKMKAIITTQVDRFRPSYGRVSVDHPRRCVFAMTTNQDEYLKDETGNRRWLPVRLVRHEADIEWLRANRDQLLAEAYHRVVEKRETIYEFPAEETLREQDMRRVSDPNEERICHWYLNELKDDARAAGITVEQVNQHALHQGFYGPMKRFEEMAIADVLRRALKLTKKRIMIEGVQAWRWVDERLTVPAEALAPAVLAEGEINPDDIPF